MLLIEENGKERGFFSFRLFGRELLLPPNVVQRGERNK